jgi:hypothetical protein
MFEEYVILIDRKMGAKNNKIELSTDQCTAHSKKTFLWDTNICIAQPLYQPVTAFRCRNHLYIQV